MFPIPDDVKDTDGNVKDGFVIYRVHYGTASVISKDTAVDDEYFEIVGDNIILHLKKFSTYAVGYTAATSSGGGSSIINATIPTITTQPIALSALVGELKTLNVTAKATDNGTLSYQWYSNTLAIKTGGTLINGATNADYTIPTVKAGTYYYYVVVTAGV